MTKWYEGRPAEIPKEVDVTMLPHFDLFVNWLERLDKNLKPGKLRWHSYLPTDSGVPLKTYERRHEVPAVIKLLERIERKEDLCPKAQERVRKEWEEIQAKRALEQKKKEEAEKAAHEALIASLRSRQRQENDFQSNDVKAGQIICLYKIDDSWSEPQLELLFDELKIRTNEELCSNLLRRLRRMKQARELIEEEKRKQNK